MAKPWQYHQSSCHAHYGTMTCSSCNQSVEHKPFRVRLDTSMKDRGFIIQCKRCTGDTTGWDLLEQQLKNRMLEIETQLEDFKAFRDKWNTSDLDETIESLETTIDAYRSTSHHMEE